MKQRCCFKLSLLFFVCVQLLLLDSIFAAPSNFQVKESVENNSVPVNGNAEIYQQKKLASDGGGVSATQIDNNVKLVGTGPVNLTLNFGKLEFKVCKSCEGTSAICYESLHGLENSFAVGSCSSKQSSCEFKASYHRASTSYEEDSIFFGRGQIYSREFPISSCLSTSMKNGMVQVLPFIFFDSCDPKIDLENKNMIKLWIDVQSSCPITVLDAKVYVPAVHTTLSPPLSTAASPSDSSTKTSEASFPWWAIMIVVIGGFLAFVGIGIVVIIVCKKRQSSKPNVPPPPSEVPKPVTTVPAANLTTVLETSSKRRGNLNFTEFEHVQRPKKDKKKHETEEPSTTEDAQPMPTNPSSVPPPIDPNATLYPTMTRSVPKGLKSVKMDSLDETTKTAKNEMAEPVMDSFGRHCPVDSDVVKKVKKHYPEIQRQIMKLEVECLTGPVSKMYAEINILAHAAEQRLTAVGCIFDEQRRLISVSKNGRRFLRDPKTAATTVYFAFGAEYHQYISVDPELMKKVSVPVLMVIVLQPRFPEMARRKACAMMRRKLYKIIGYYTAADRTKMAFPINIVELAYCKDLRLGYVQTDSEGERRKKAEEAQAQKNGKGVAQLRDGGKKK